MKDLNQNNSNPWGCFLVLVLGTAALMMVVKALKLPRATETKVLADVTLPLTTVVSLGLLLVIAALFRR